MVDLRRTSNSPVLRYPTKALWSQIPAPLHPEIEKSMYHEDNGELMIPVPTDRLRSRLGQENMAWDRLVALIHAAVYSTVPVAPWMISKAEKAKVREL